MANEEGVPVELYIYDLTKGLASLLSPTILGRQVEGVWHTSVVVFGREYFYGGAGVTSCAPGSTQLGAPYQIDRLGTTFVPFAVFDEYIQGLATTTYTGAAYRLLEHNCNHFSDEVAQFSCGARVPKHIVAQAERDLPPPLRLALQAALERLAPGAPVAGRHPRPHSPDYLTLNDQIEEARVVSQQLDARRSTLAEKLARKERRREKKRRKHGGREAAGDEGEDATEDDMAEALPELAEREVLAGPSAPDHDLPPKDPPIVFRDIDGAAEYEAFSKALEGVTLSEEERRSADELQQYLVQGEGSWVLGDDFLAFIGRLLADSEVPGKTRVQTLRCLAAAALRDDVSLLLHQDRRHHALLAYAQRIDALPDDEQQALALFMCNLFENTSSSEWLLYISEWEANGQTLSNIRVTTKGSTQLGAPYQIDRLGTTFVPFAVFDEYIKGLATTTYTGAAYRLLEHNCNHFSDEVAQFSCGARVPKHIVAQAERDLPPPLRLALQAALERLAPGAPVAGRHPRPHSPDYLTLNDQIEEARVVSQQLDARRSTLAEKLARKERRREKKRRKHGGREAAGDEGEDATEDDMAEALPELAEREVLAGPSAPDHDLPPKDPPIVFRDIDGAAEYEAFSKALEGVTLSEEERRSADELQQYLVQGEGSWVLGDDFLAFIGRLLADSEVPGKTRVQTLRCLAAAALRDDVSLLLHQDRRHHALLAYAQRIDALPDDEQQALALFMCNLFENTSSSEWLLYISEWEANGQTLSNIRVTTKVCVHGVLSSCPALRDAGTALLYNIATKEVKTVRLSLGGALRRPLPASAKVKVFDEVCVELCMAALQLCAWAPPEELLWRALAALARLAAHSADVPQLVALVGPDPAAFRGTSPRVDEQVELIAQRVATRG